MKCIKCSAELTLYDIGFYKKLVNRGAEEFMCISCTSEHFRISSDDAAEMIKRFQKQGCTLFPKADN